LGDLEYFLYVTDEPGPDMYQWVRDRAAWIHDNPGPGQNLPVFLTKWPMSDLVGAIDIWCTPPQLYDPADAADAQARGERVWLYASYRPQTPADATDEYGIAWRVKAWIGHYRDIPRWFTWESTHYYNNSNEVDPGGRKNVWANPIGFSRDRGGGVPCPQDTGNGDGILFYPGQDALFPEEDRNYPGPVSSIRMKMYRRGAQDVEYMWLAEQLGFATEVGAMLDSLLPHVMWNSLTVPDWSNSNAVYEQARRQLADLIDSRIRFADVSTNHWAFWEVDTCVEAGIVSGYGDGNYRPDLAVTRDQMAVYISRALAGGNEYVPDFTDTPTFSDVGSEHWALDYVEYAFDQNVVTGYDDGSYHPEYEVTRDQMAVYVARSICDPTGEEGLAGYVPAAPRDFPDVASDFWAYRHIEYCVEKGVVAGYPDGSYYPNSVVTREQMAVYVARAFKLPM
jgi:hypothetical protein